MDKLTEYLTRLNETCAAEDREQLDHIKFIIQNHDQILEFCKEHDREFWKYKSHYWPITQLLELIYYGNHSPDNDDIYQKIVFKIKTGVFNDYELGDFSIKWTKNFVHDYLTITEHAGWNQNKLIYEFDKSNLTLVYFGSYSEGDSKHVFHVKTKQELFDLCESFDISCPVEIVEDIFHLKMRGKHWTIKLKEEPIVLDELCNNIRSCLWG